MYDIIVFENLLFRQREAGVLKNVYSGDRFLKPAFFICVKTQFTCGRKAKTEEKNSVCQKDPATCRRGLSLTSRCSCLERTK